MFKFISYSFLLLSLPVLIQAQDKTPRVIVIGAHPDDCESDAGGTAALFSEMGYAVKFVSLTNGDAGHQDMGGGVLAKRRFNESMEAGKILGVEEYVVLDNHDGELEPTLEIRKQVIREIRKWKADIVLAPRPNDYHPDHRYTGILVQDAAYMVGVPNVAADTPPLERNPVFIYTQDYFKRPNPFRPDIAVDISNTYEKKIRSLAAHESQFFEWLPWISGYEGVIPTDKNERIEWLKETRSSGITEEVRTALTKWYGQEAASKAKFAEAFEICEYGRQPSDEEIRQLFPMLER